MGRGVTGRAPLTEKRERFAQMLAQGVSNAEACRFVGVHRRTGMRWRHGRTVIANGGRRRDYPAVVDLKQREYSARYLSEDERVVIADLHRQGESVRRIATSVGRSPATISRELRRNPDERGRYRPFKAHQLAASRRPRPRKSKFAGDEVLRTFVQNGLKKRWSPEQISHEIRREFPDDHERHVVHETIYQAIYRPDLGGLTRDPSQRPLRSRRLRRRPRRRPGARRAGALIDMTMIDQRPAEAEDRSVPGHWEGDLITGSDNRSAIGTLVERSSRLAILVHLPGGRHTATVVRDALIDAMSVVPPHLRRSLTWDQGKELALHGEIARSLGMPVFFCERASPWQRPSNENTNGLLRQYFPKGTDLRVHKPDYLAFVAEEMNTRPRKTLDWQTPAAQFNAWLPPASS